jgi:hypothetical protein
LHSTQVKYTLAPTRVQALRNMLEHLIDYTPPVGYAEDAAPVAKATPADILSAQVSTSDFLASLGAPTEDALASTEARDAFHAVASAQPDEKQRAALVAIKTPAAVRHLTGMLTAYDWEFVQQAKEIRGYAVSQILEETKHPDARIRLRALELLGRVTEVALFTDRVEVKKTELKDSEIDDKIKEKLARFMGVTDVRPTDAVLIEDTNASA